MMMMTMMMTPMLPLPANRRWRRIKMQDNDDGAILKAYRKDVAVWPIITIENKSVSIFSIWWNEKKSSCTHTHTHTHSLKFCVMFGKLHILEFCFGSYHRSTLISFTRSFSHCRSESFAWQYSVICVLFVFAFGFGYRLSVYIYICVCVCVSMSLLLHLMMWLFVKAYVFIVCTI